MDSCSLDAILLPSMFAIKNKIIGTPCHEDPSCIGYTIVVPLFFLFYSYFVSIFDKVHIPIPKTLLSYIQYKRDLHGMEFQ